MTNAPLQNDPSDNLDVCDREIIGFSTIVHEESSCHMFVANNVNEFISQQ